MRDIFVEVPVIIEPVAGNGYRAIGAGGLSVGLTAEGATVAEAVDRLANQVRTRGQRWRDAGRNERCSRTGSVETRRRISA